MKEKLLIPEPQAHFSKEKEYKVSEDLRTTRPFVIPAWTDTGAGIQTISLYMQGDSFNRYSHINLRSRIAQAGLDWIDYQILSEDVMQLTLRNFSLRDVSLAENLGVSYLYRPSQPAKGYQLIHAVSQHIDIHSQHLVFADVEGNIWDPETPTNTMHSMPDSLMYMGISIDRETLFEVNPEQELVEVGVITDVRQDATGKLRHSDEETMTPFGVTTTVPISVNGSYLTLVDDLYNNLKHLPSLVIHPNRSQWNATNTNNAGIRLEYYAQNNKPLTRKQLPPYAFVTVHPTEQ